MEAQVGLSARLVAHHKELLQPQVGGVDPKRGRKAREDPRAHHGTHPARSSWGAPEGHVLGGIVAMAARLPAVQGRGIHKLAHQPAALCRREQS